MTGTYLKQISRKDSDRYWDYSSPARMDIYHGLFRYQTWCEQRLIMIATCKRTLKKISTMIRQLMGKKKPTRAVLDFIRTTRAGRCFEERESREKEAESDKRWGMEEVRIKRDG